MTTTLNQWAEFLLALSFGAVLGGWYDLFFVLRTLFVRRPASTPGLLLCAALDLLFWLTAAAGAALFLLRLNGLCVRFFLLLGFACGFAAWRFSAGALFRRLFFALKRLCTRLYGGLKKLAR